MGQTTGIVVGACCCRRLRSERFRGVGWRRDSVVSDDARAFSWPWHCWIRVQECARPKWELGIEHGVSSTWIMGGVSIQNQSYACSLLCCMPYPESKSKSSRMIDTFVNAEIFLILESWVGDLLPVVGIKLTPLFYLLSLMSRIENTLWCEVSGMYMMASTDTSWLVELARDEDNRLLLGSMQQA